MASAHKSVGKDSSFAAEHGVAADSPPSHSLGPLALLARLAAERRSVRPRNELGRSR